MKPLQKITKKISSKAYNKLLLEIVTMVQQHRLVAVRNVQIISNQLYWNIGELILTKQKEYGWGKSIVEKLSRDLQYRVGNAVSWSPRNLWFMRQVVAEYSNLKQPVSELKKLKQLISEFPWGHNIIIMQKTKDIQARIFYLQTTIKNKYSRSVLLHQIEADAYGHYLLHPSQHNFTKTLPKHFSEQTQESIKSVYTLDFLDINKAVTERELENTIVEKVKHLIMELGYGFCFVGNQYRLTLGNKEYFVDLLFYHRILKCLVAVELKVTEFEPEFVGKLNFYLQLIDEQLKQPDDRPSIGILLVPHKNKVEVEYTLRTASKPIGVAQYSLRKTLPTEFLGKLPSAKEFQKILTPKKRKR